MPYEGLKNTLGQAAFQNLASKTPQGKQSLVEGNLRNRMLQLQLEEEVPVKIEMLRKQLEFMISKPEEQAMALEAQKDFEQFRTNMAEFLNNQQARQQESMAKMGQKFSQENIKMKGDIDKEIRAIPTQQNIYSEQTGTSPVREEARPTKAQYDETAILAKGILEGNKKSLVGILGKDKAEAFMRTEWWGGKNVDYDKALEAITSLTNDEIEKLAKKTGESALPQMFHQLRLFLNVDEPDVTGGGKYKRVTRSLSESSKQNNPSPPNWIVKR